MSLSAPAVGSPYRVLIIDEAMHLARPLLSQLSEVGFECHYASSGIQGLAAFHEMHPHLILLDYAMPDMNGGEVCSRIRETSAVPIIMLLENGSPPPFSRKVAANEYASKAIPAEEIVERVERLLDCVYHSHMEEDAHVTSMRIPSGWASCERCSYMGPRVRFEVMLHGEPHLTCPHCRRDDSIVLAIS